MVLRINRNAANVSLNARPGATRATLGEDIEEPAGRSVTIPGNTPPAPNTKNTLPKTPPQRIGDALSRRSINPSFNNASFRK